MRNFTRHFIFVITLAILFAGGCSEKSPEKSADISVSSSYLDSAVRDIAGSNLDVFSVVPPGMCPGHFDISPSQVSKVCNSKVLLIFGFQERMKDSLANIANEKIRIETIRPNGGLCVPDTYITVCGQVCDVLCECFPEKSEQFRKRFGLLKTRVDDLKKRVKNKIEKSGLKGEKAVCSVHQEKFARWLGLKVVGTFEGRDTETAGSLNESIKAGIKQKAGFVIANKQEGTRLAEVIAERLGAKTVVFSNFPKIGGGDDFYFAELVEQNISRLTEAKE